MTEVRIVTLIRRIALTTDGEIDCGECTNLTAGYAEALLAGQDGADRWQPVKEHLSQCSTCWEEFDGLCQIARKDLEGDWPNVSWLIARLSGPDLIA